MKVLDKLTGNYFSQRSPDNRSASGAFRSGIAASSASSQTVVDQTTQRGSTVKSGGDINVISTEGDLTVTGSTISGQNVTRKERCQRHFRALRSVSDTVLTQRSQNEVTAQTSEVVGSSVKAGGRVDISAAGAGEDSDIRISGSDVYGGTGASLSADDDIDIVAAQSVLKQKTENSSSGWNVGVAISYGSGGWAAGITAGGNVGKGNGEGQTVTNINSHVGSGGTTTLTSGGTTAIRGGQVSGERVEVDANELVIESLQDTETYKSKQMDASAQVTAGYGVSVSASYNQSKIDSDYASVNEQSGILAGDGGYTVKVKGNTDLKGGIITSTQMAEAAGNNRFSTGTLTSSDIENRAVYEASAFGLSGSMGKNGSGEQGEHQLAQGSSDGKAGGTAASKSVGFGQDGDHQSSTTHSGINTKNITITDVEGQAATDKTADQIKADIATTTTTDTVAENSGALANKFDAAEVQKEIDLQVQVTQSFDRTQQGVRNEINTSIDEAKQRKEDAEAALKDPTLNAQQKATQIAIALDAQSDIERLQKVGILVSTIASGLSSPADSAGGILASTLAPEASYLIGQHFKENAARNVVDGGNRGEEGSATHLLAHALLGAAVAASGGSSALIGGIVAGGAEAAAPALAQLLYGKQAKDLNAEEKSTISAIVGAGGAAIGSIGGDMFALISSSSAAQNAVDNNWGEVGHYSTMATVLYLAGFSEQDAKAVALAAWSPDTDRRNAITVDNLLQSVFSADEQQRIHLLDGESDPKKVAAKQQELGAAVAVIFAKIKQYENNPAIKAAILSDSTIQRLLHSFGDSYAHVEADGTHYPPLVGHASDSLNQPDPDSPYSHKNAYSNYAIALYHAAAGVSNSSLVDATNITALADGVASNKTESAQKRVLSTAITSHGGKDAADLVSSPLPDCGYLESCVFLNAANTANPVIRETYGLPKDPWGRPKDPWVRPKVEPWARSAPPSSPVGSTSGLRRSTVEPAPEKIYGSRPVIVVPLRSQPANGPRSCEHAQDGSSSVGEIPTSCGAARA